MNPAQQQAVLTIALLAAFADGANDDREREAIRRLTESLGGPELAAVYQDVLLKRADLKQAVAALTEASHRQLAYEMAVCVCDADGRTTDAERRFLGELAPLLGLGTGVTGPLDREAETVAALTEAAAPVRVQAAVATAAAATAGVPDAELDRAILNAAMLCGALELLPQSWASMAIIPLQIKMVYGVGKAHGYELDQGHIREVLATVGVGMTSQYLEQFGRKLLGGLLGGVAGGLGKALGGTATGAAFSFATTYALGQAAKRYYAGGRQMNTAVLQDTFKGLLGPAQALQAQYLPQIRERAGTLDLKQIASLVRGA